MKMTITPYQNAPGKTEGSMRDPSINKRMNKNDLTPLPDYDFLRLLSGDAEGIKPWINLKAGRPLA